MHSDRWCSREAARRRTEAYRIARIAYRRPKRPIRSVAVLGLVLPVLVGQHLNAQTIVTYPVPTFYSANPEILFDGTNIWVTGGSSSVTKLLASTGSLVG